MINISDYLKKSTKEHLDNIVKTYINLRSEKNNLFASYNGSVFIVNEIYKFLGIDIIISEICFENKDKEEYLLLEELVDAIISGIIISNIENKDETYFESKIKILFDPHLVDTILAVYKNNNDINDYHILIRIKVIMKSLADNGSLKKLKIH